VLVVDDDADVRAFAAAALDAIGHTVVQAPGGGEALAHIETAPPDAVLLDYAMPGMTGAEVAKIIGRTHPKLPIIFMTGYADAAALEPILGRQAMVLRKPFRIDELGFALNGALARGAASNGG
jgi:CheY-like chemotaxis protein